MPPKKSSFLRRASSTAFINHPRRKPTQTTGAKRQHKEDDESTSEERLSFAGIVTSLPPPGGNQDVLSLMQYVEERMFTEIPERSAGMNSTRIAEVLNFRKNLPPIVSLAHLHALSKSTTATEREIARLVQTGMIRKVSVLGRGKGGAPTGDGLVQMEDWKRLVRDSGALEESVKDKYISLLEAHPTSPTISSSAFGGTEASELMSAGFLTATSALASESVLLSRPGAFSLGASASVATSGSRAATGTLAAVGGSGAVHESGGGGRGLHAASRVNVRVTGDLTFSLPAMGVYLRLLTEAKAHLLQLIAKSSPKYKETPRDILRERWDGGIPVDDAANRAKRARGEWVGVLPGKTKKWKNFYGMEFNWILEECLGGGAVECFETGSVGLGVRAI
ncbi:hypothetical protein H2203_001200 [Taxawa tesnikishii (nom. ined.)]|nr:hypothetical protein H2203_001200 [Dothideales sp. JES 119]